ncbi:MAG: hypothetical protein ACJ8D5_07760 [Sphingomicrobium sp.]
MTKGTIAAGVLWLSIAAPAAARDPLSRLPPAPRFIGASGELATRLLVAHNVDRAAVGDPPRAPRNT